MNIQNTINKLKTEDVKKILGNFLDAYLTPAFGSIPKREVDLLVFDLLEKIGYTKREPDLYSLVQQLRISRSKARNLLYDNELRKLTTDDLDKKVKASLKNLVIQKQGNLFALEIESPLVADHLRSKLKDLNHTSDGSFSPSLIKLSKSALIAVIESYLSAKEQKAIQRALTNAGMPDKSFKGMLSGVLKVVGKKIASDAGEDAAEAVGKYISPIIDGTANNITKIFTDLFEKEKKKD